jgi:hypothetical protein
MAAACFIPDVADFSLAVHQPLTGYEHPDKLALGFCRQGTSHRFSAVITGTTAGRTAVQLRLAGKIPSRFSLSSGNSQLSAIYKKS